MSDLSEDDNAPPVYTGKDIAKSPLHINMAYSDSRFIRSSKMNGSHITGKSKLNDYHQVLQLD